MTTRTPSPVQRASSQPPGTAAASAPASASSAPSIPIPSKSELAPLPLARAACRRQASTHQGEAALSAGAATHDVLLLRNGDAEDKRREGATTRLIAWLDGVLGSGDGEKEHG